MTTPPATSLLQIDATVIGMDFVLTLESPCLSHIDIAHSESNRTSTGHALMASASILHQNHNPPGERLNSETSWQVPGLGLERLLELSESIVLDECELTPVQAWDYIRRHPQFAELETERLEVLKEKLVRQIKCYGFGGVIDRNVLEDAVFETFVVGRVF
ncbi:hypothetical protein T440DRAFT_513649 [Plenodomus tracheiphilus IPT5]|uniref:Uncharacterized protein n=1 Tax=Plenodomus tracheiphilus IPT5 TaxID=1408161 RepID=A0A6A7BM79_9PLEO|nr:hypothetical protein T440DRAFT_513649 [Plenodomus tracheiphilus IPT5]